MELTKEDKLKILARNFYNDNTKEVDSKNGYKNYSEALSEFFKNSPSDSFIDSVLRNYIKQETGKKLFMNDEGFLITLRESDNFIEFVNVITEKDARKIQARSLAILNADPDISETEALSLAGWREVGGLNDKT
jgi:hypothetical protein